MINITPSMKEKMLSTIKVMKNGNKSFMPIEGAEGFSVILDEEDNQNVIVLGAEEVEGVKYFLCQMLDK